MCVQQRRSCRGGVEPGNAVARLHFLHALHCCNQPSGNFVLYKPFHSGTEEHQLVPAANSTHADIHLTVREGVCLGNHTNFVQSLPLTLVYCYTISRRYRKLTSAERERQPRLFRSYHKTNSWQLDQRSFARSSEQLHGAQYSG